MTGAAGSSWETPVELAADPPVPINILIVDDEPGNLAVLETVLDDPGYRLVRAQSADQALLALVREEFAVLILDIRMPGMTGFELAQLVKERKKTARVPIIFLTAYYDKDQHILEGYGSGAVDYLNKPVNPAVLRSKVSVFADLYRKSRALILANRALIAEVEERRRAEEKLRDLNETLERRVTERTEALRLADYKLQAMMSSITDGLLMLDREWRFTFANEQGARLLGMRVEDILGRNVGALFPDTYRAKFAEGYQRAVQTGQAVSFEEFYPEPLKMWFQCHCYPSDEGLSVYFHDITDRREVEVRREQLLAAEQAARSEGDRLARANDDFLASVSHELRTPLAAIVGWVNVLKRPGAGAETLRRGIDAIERNAQSQSHLIADLLDMSRIVSGKLRMTIERVDLKLVAAAAADTLRPAAHNKGVQIELQLAVGPAVEVMGDSLRLQQIATNLMTNAIKFTPAGGVVTIGTSVDPSHAELLVTDTGQGIAAEFLPHLFDRFSQADGSAARAHGGLGLGLAIVKNLVELHSGTVTASSAGKDQGACFRVRFPLITGASGQAGTARPLPTPEPAGAPGMFDRPMMDGETDLRGVSILLVDDHPDVLEVERRLLGDYGATVTTATSAEEALACIQGSRFDVLLSDLGMPGRDGYALIRDIRSTLGIGPSQLPAAAVTAFVRPEDKQRALEEGYQGFVQKPVSPTALARAVLDLLRERAQFPATGVVRLRTLFVEDNPDLREQIGWMLEEEGLDLVSCASGEEAEAEFQKRDFDVVVTDVSLPKMTGVQLAKRLLAQAPHTWVVFSTGYPMGENLAAIGRNVRALLKPFEAEELHLLMNEVREALHQPGTGVPNSRYR